MLDIDIKKYMFSENDISYLKCETVTKNAALINIMKFLSLIRTHTVLYMYANE